MVLGKLHMKNKFINEIKATAKNHKSNYAGTEHILAYFTRKESMVLAKVLLDMGLSHKTIMEDVNRVNDTWFQASEPVKLSNTVDLIMEVASFHASRDGREEVSECDVVIGLLSTSKTVAYEILRKHGVDQDTLLGEYVREYERQASIKAEQNVDTKAEPKEEVVVNNTSDIKSEPQREYRPRSLKGFEGVRSFVTDITRHYNNKSEKEILGRDREIESVWISLSKKTKSNCMLIGEAGVGKTAIIEELARQIVTFEAPKQFHNYVLIDVNIGAIVSGTKYRGDFEEKMKTFIEFVESNKNMIIFMDEIHQIVGAGKGEGTLDVATLIKPLLARDSSRLIGATTIKEHAIISKDGALNRRFDVHIVREPEKSKVKEMIAKKVEKLQRYHKTDITDTQVEKIIDLAHSRIKDRMFPDKALDVIDYAMARGKILGKTKFDMSSVYAYLESISTTIEEETKTEVAMAS